MADMTREEARKLVYDLTQYIDGQITKSKEIKAMKMLIEDSKKLEAYENADIIERDVVLDKMNEYYKALMATGKNITADGLIYIESAFKSVPRFNSAKGDSDD